MRPCRKQFRAIVSALEQAVKNEIAEERVIEKALEYADRIVTSHMLQKKARPTGRAITKMKKPPSKAA
jgi:regulator of sirC expression with transglutaminase-like and TPR domain